MRSLMTSAVTAVLLATLAAGCGGEESADEGGAASPTEAASTPAAGGLTVTDGTTPDELVDCLTGAGLDATTTDTTMLGVEVPHAKVEVTEFAGYESATSQNADLWVFQDPAAAADNAPYITLGGSDDPTNTRFTVAGNVLLEFWVVTGANPTEDEKAVLGCLPAQGRRAAEGRSTEASTGASGDPTSGEPASGATGTVTADQVLACVTAAGLTATVETEDVSYYGAEARVVVSGMPGSAQGAMVWVFTDAATAEANLTNIWFGGTPSPRLRVQGNTVTVFDAAPSEGDPAVLAVEQCLPA